MNLSEALAKKAQRLHHVEEKDKRIEKPGQNTEADLEQFTKKVHSVNVEQWLDQITDLTFRTWAFDLDMQTAKVVVKFYEAWTSAQKQSLLPPSPLAESSPLPTPASSASSGTQFTSKSFAFKSPLTDAENDVMLKLEQHIDKILAENDLKDKGAFVRLSTRSPKDATIAGDKMLRQYKELLQQSKFTDTDKSHVENNHLISLIQASTRSLRIHDGKEAIELITHSGRSHEDLLLALEFPSKYDMKIIIREWNEMDPMHEFRGFVNNHRLTALSQYFHIVHFPQLPQQKKDIEAKIKQFYTEKVRDRLAAISGGTSNYVIDFGILEDGRIIVIELNPFSDYQGCGTDACLFSWKADRQIVDGEKDFEFRIVDNYFPDVKKLIIDAWRLLITNPPQ